MGNRFGYYANRLRNLWTVNAGQRFSRRVGEGMPSPVLHAIYAMPRTCGRRYPWERADRVIVIGPSTLSVDDVVRHELTSVGHEPRGDPMTIAIPAGTARRGSRAKRRAAMLGAMLLAGTGLLMAAPA